MKRVKLLERRPFKIQDSFTWYDVGDEFLVIQERVMPCMGLGYKIQDEQFDIVLDGFHNAKDFEIIKN